MEITSIIQIWKWFKWLPKFILKRIFSKKRLAELIYVDIKPRGEAVRVSINETSSFNIYLQFINMSPFEVELERAELELNFSGVGVKSTYLKKCKIKAGEIYDLYITDYIDSGRNEVLNRMAQTCNESSVALYCGFNSILHVFEKENVYLSAVNVKYMGVKRLEENV
ncbi:hypothetical protein [Marinagarivorans algicola]|uniref:hypothetical protein n=1 Tax=Marinagarivorans algicola TaxID=1513270 RepID=UPI003735AB1D